MDPLDEQLRGAMKALDALIPGLPDQYFDQLPDQIMNRLEDPTTMQPTGQNSSPDSSRTVLPPPAAAAAPAPAARVEDSGLHDLKALAQSTKQRMSRRIPTQNPVDDIALGASSSGLRAVALPEPARMVALPELSAVGLEPAATRSKAPSAAPVVPSSLSAVDAAPAVAATSATSAPAFSLGGRAAAAPARKSRAPLMAAGAALAAAAGVVGFLALRPDSNKATSPAAGASPAGITATELPAEPVTAERSAVAAPAAAAPALGVGAAEGMAAPSGAGGQGESDATSAARAADKADDNKAKDRKDSTDGRSGSGKGERDDKDGTGDKGGKGLTTPGAGSGAAVLKGDQQDQSLDDLLREAGVDPNAPKKADKPTLDKKGLTAGDIRTAMSARAGAARDCFSKDGPSGNVPVKLAVAPDGSVKSAKAGGAFAGTARGECVAKAAAGASFPAWDGAVMTVNYTYSPPDE